jgi:ATP-dependent Lon protease
MERVRQTSDPDVNGASNHRADIPFLRERARAADLPDAALTAAEHELTRLERLPVTSGEYGLTRAYLDWLLALPWTSRTDDRLDIKAARHQLEEGHFGLEAAKEQIINHLAVMRLRGDGRSPVLCIVGPPGSGKTSLGHSIARVLGRTLVRISLRGICDEMEISGQRRTSLDALPGKIMRGIRTSGVKNPVFMLEQIDRLGRGGRGDVQAALFEALEPKLRARFTDQYLDLPFDLSETFFIVTAHLFEAVPESLRDCLEPVTLPGYVQEEKYEIARHYLLPRERERSGLSAKQFDIDEWALKELSRGGPGEAGLNGLQERIAELARQVAGEIAGRGRRSVRIDKSALAERLATPITETGMASNPEVGVAKAAVITPAGAVISNVEVTRVDGRPELTLTGPQSHRMRELVQTALTILRARAKRFDLQIEVFDTCHLHLHFHDELAQSDLASVGVSTVAALTSAFTGKPIRADLALTGGLSLRGRLRRVPGIIDKVLAARRLELAHLVIPRAQSPELERLPGYVLKAVNIHPVETVDEALELSLLQIIVPKPEETSAIEMFQAKPPNDSPNRPGA